MNETEIDQYFFDPRPVFNEYDGKTVRFWTPELEGPRIGVIELGGRYGCDNKISLTIVEDPIFLSAFTRARFSWRLSEDEIKRISPLGGAADYEICP
jgi:hypothetical protein